MINIINELKESVDIIDIGDDKSVLIEEEYNELYKKLVMEINSAYKSAIDKINENLIAIRDYKLEGSGKFTVHALTANPSIDLVNFEDIKNMVSNLKKNNETSSQEYIPIDIKSLAKDKLGSSVEVELTNDDILKLREKIIYLLDDIKYRIGLLLDAFIDNLCKCDTQYLFNEVYKKAIAMLANDQANAYALMISYLELYNMKNKDDALTESVSNEDVSTYISELKELIPKCREFFDKFKYKEIITPRKKTIPKMTEYMRGALERKYTLRIPIYKVTDASDDAKKIVEERFIKGLDRIIDKYPNYVLLTPDFKDDSDMFIYITLKEPFGDKGDRSDRVQQSKDDGAVIAEGAGLVALITAGMVGGTIWGIVKSCKEIAAQKKLSNEIKKQDKESKERFNLQKKKLTAIKEFDFRYISNIPKVIKDAKFVKCKKGTLEVAKKIHDENIEFINSLRSTNDIAKLYNEYTNSINSILNGLTSEFIDVKNKDELGKIFSNVYNDYISVYSECINYGFDAEIYSAKTFESWRSLGESIKIQLEGDVLNETALTSKERDELPDDIFGLPGRRFPLNDKDHILAAISRMYTVKSAEEKQLLAKNIEKQIIKQNLLGKVSVSKDNPNKKYFSKIIEECANLDYVYMKEYVNKVLQECEDQPSNTLEFYI